MKLALASPAVAQRLSSHVHSRYGVSKDVMRAWRWMLHGSSAWVFHADARLLDAPSVNVFQLGLLAFSDAETFEPTSHIIALLGDAITQNRVALSESHVESFFARKNIPVENLDVSRVLSDGFVAVSLNGKVIGSASVTRKHLIPNLPPLHHGGESD